MVTVTVRVTVTVTVTVMVTVTVRVTVMVTVMVMVMVTVTVTVMVRVTVRVTVMVMVNYHLRLMTYIATERKEKSPEKMQEVYYVGLQKRFSKKKWLYRTVTDVRFMQVRNIYLFRKSVEDASKAVKQVLNHVREKHPMFEIDFGVFEQLSFDPYESKKLYEGILKARS